MDVLTHAAAIPITKRIPPVDKKISRYVGQRQETRYAVLVNDMLNDFVHGKLRSNRAFHIIPKLRAL
ncbi:MAG: hypothetical protein WBL68_11355 [Nitrososphaeraceae archaeon]